MKIKTFQLESLQSLICKLSHKIFNIETQYKMLKIKKYISEEIEIYQEQLKTLEQFFVIENGNFVISESGGYKIKQNKLQECEEFVKKLNSLEIQLPEIYFSLDELENLQLSLEELEILMPFIK